MKSACCYLPAYLAIGLIGLATAQPPQPSVNLETTVTPERVRDLSRAARSVQVVEPGNTARTINANAELRLAPNEFLAVRTARDTEIEETVGGRVIGRLPIELEVPSETGDLETLEIRFETTGLNWAETGVFTGDLLLGVVARDATTPSGALATAVDLQVVAQDATVSPTLVSIDRRGVPFEVVALEAPDPAEPFNVRVLASFDPQGMDIPVSVRRPALELFVSPANSINGFGIEDADLTVTSSEGPDAAGRTVIVTTTRGNVAETELVLNAAGIARTSVRSAQTGSATVTATSGPFAPAEVAITFAFPTLFLWAIGLGTVLGATVWTYLLGTGRNRGTTAIIVDWLVGAAAGVGLTFAVFGRIDLGDYLPLPADISGEVTAAGIAFLAALLGVTVSRILVRNRGPRSATTSA